MIDDNKVVPFPPPAGSPGGQIAKLGRMQIAELEIARNVVESQRLSTLIDYATAAPFAIGFLETALAIEDSSNGI